jgi:hypothetical protein
MGEWRERKQSLSPLKGKSLLKIFSNFSTEERKDSERVLEGNTEEENCSHVVFK